MIYNLLSESLDEAFDISALSLNEAYDITGNIVFSKGGGDIPSEPIDKYKNYTIEMLPYNTPCGQDFAYYNGKIVAATSTSDELKVINASTGASLAASFSVSIGHCNSIVFSDEFYDQSDEFPLLCASYSGFSYYRISNTYDSAQQVKNYKLQTPPVDTSTNLGYGFGFDSGYLYMIGYTSGSYQPSSTNLILLAKYDLQNPIDNGDGTFTLPLIYTKRREWFECIQGSQVHDGFMWVNSGFTSPGHVYALDLVTAEILLDIPMEEYTDLNDYSLIVSSKNKGSNTGIFRITFPDIEPISYEGKTLSILGDSISTYSGTMPEGNANYYTGSNCGVGSVNDIWWKKLITSLGMTLDTNNSWSGSTVSGSDNSSGVTRATALGTSPDVIIVYLGINDFNHEVPLETFRSSYTTMLNTIMSTYPDSEVWCATLLICERNGDIGGDIEINDSGVPLSDFNTVITATAKAYGANVLDHFSCGITYSNMSTYMGDWTSSGQALHPNASGHTMIANYDIEHMTSKEYRQ